jgi:exonuclease SbcD
LSYSALGHIHKPQDLNEGHQPPAVYPGSIERVDFGEIEDPRYFVIAHVAPGQATRVEWRRLEGIRPFVSRYVKLDSDQGITSRLQIALGPPESLEGAIVRLILEYPRQWDTLLDEASLRQYTAGAFEFHLVKRPQMEARIRLQQDQTISSLTPLDLLEKYWAANNITGEECQALQDLAKRLLDGADTGNEPQVD